MRTLNAIAAGLLAVGLAGTAQADAAKVAVAANFTEPAAEIGRLFAQASGHRAVFSFGSTGQLYAQISQGAPFAVFLAADQARPKRAVDDGFGVPGSVFTYAAGRIVLFSLDPALVDGAATLAEARFARLAIANPELAPYGAAAAAAMRALGVHDALRAKFVRGNNIAQTYQFVATGNAELGFVALSQVIGHDEGSRWIVPAALHAPIAQDAVLLRRGAENPAALAFMAFLQGPEAAAVKRKYGYGAGE